MPKTSDVKLEGYLDRNLALEAVRVTEAAALAASKFVGFGDKIAADQAAVDAMRLAFNGLRIDGTVIIGEGTKDEAPMLYIGEKIGTKEGPKVEIAVDPLEGTALAATGDNGAIAVLAMAREGGFFKAPDIRHIDQIVVGCGLPKDVIDLNQTVTQNIKSLMKAKKCDAKDLMVMILDRPKHAETIKELRSVGARITIIPHGTINATLATTDPHSGVDMLIGEGGTTEAIIAAAALRCTGGQMKIRLVYDDEEEKQKARDIGIKDLNKIYDFTELATGDVMFAATGVTNGSLLRGVRRFGGGAETHSIVLRSKSGTIRYVEAHHNFNRKVGCPPVDE